MVWGFLVVFTIIPSEWRQDFPWQKKSPTLRIACSQSKISSVSNKDSFVLESVYAKDFAGLALSQEGVSKGVK